MNNHLISIVVPVYNVEAYLPVCVESLLAQTYKNIEIIAVDDGATDSCPEILDYYAAKDNRVHVIHQKNGGLSAARNTALMVAKGEYITFIDSDDYVSPVYVEYLYRAASKNKADICICDYCKVPDSYAEQSPANIVSEKTYSNVETIKEAYQPIQHGMEFLACGKLYKTTLFYNYGITYPVGKLHEDMFTTYRLMYYANKAVFIDAVLYYYRSRPGSITTSSFDIRRCSILEAHEGACIFFESLREDDLLRYAFNAYLRSAATLCCRLKRHYHGSDKKEQLDKVLDHCRTTLHRYRVKTKLSWQKQMFYSLFFQYPNLRLAKFLKIYTE